MNDLKATDEQVSNPAVVADRWDLLPTVSFKHWSHGSTVQRMEIARALYSCAIDSGFFYLSDHGVSQSIVDSAYEASQLFHALPSSTKDKYHIAKSKIHRGWVSTSETQGFEQDGVLVDNYYEAFDLSYEVSADDPRASDGYGLIGPNVWPDLPGFREAVSNYYDAVHDLGRSLMSAFEMSLGLSPDTFLQHVTIPPAQLRLLRYFENDAPKNEINAGISPHSDYECFTILHTSGPGLQVMSSQDHWVEAPPAVDSFIVNIGDCLEAWTAGLFKSTQHRVINLGEERYSLPHFFAVDFDTLIEPLDQFQSRDSLERYPPFHAGEHLWARTISTFPYLKAKYDEGELIVDFDVAQENPFRRLSVEERAELAVSHSDAI